MNRLSKLFSSTRPKGPDDVFYEDVGIDTSKDAAPATTASTGTIGAAVVTSALGGGATPEKKRTPVPRTKTITPTTTTKNPLNQPLLTAVDVSDDGPMIAGSSAQPQEPVRGRKFSQFSIRTGSPEVDVDIAPEPDYTCWEHIASYCFCCPCCPSRL